ncbi:Methyl-CpG DNA binding,SET domain,Pre-SET domain,DNA-binding domain [Cinara cedri]|uniref:Methyl-CpG DNA binding,SET domain,Pre-SET domain,DNA-binding domain n=1 Tax=Cinara cedri TaxID=506608 RepID=A0A5E4NGN5_9HEMI|nr:Methyl-CpG DNA binding,SET domain,Pre-SET domain,DNA-binding domain [Cinara cedri]
MASSNGSSNGSSTENAKGKKINNQRLQCVNRYCMHGDGLMKAYDFVCNYYHVRFTRTKEVCSTCFKNCLDHFNKLKVQWDNGKCLLKTPFPSFESYFMIESSSEDENDKSVPKEVLNLIPKDPKLLAMANLGFNYYFENNKEIIDKHWKLCENEHQKMLKNCIAQADKIDKKFKNLETEFESVKTSIYAPYRPTTEVIEVFHVQESNKKVDNNVNVMSGMTHNEENRIEKDNIVDSLNSIKISNKPDGLPNKGPLEYSDLRVGQQMFGKRLSLLDPWDKCKIKAVINTEYLHLKFGTNEMILMTKEVAYFDPSSVQYPIGSRVIAKLSKNEKPKSEYYAGVITEPPVQFNNFRYMVFFDNGDVGYRHHDDIRLIANKSINVLNEVHDNFKEFLRSYLGKYPKREMVSLSNNHLIRAKFNQQWMVAKTIEVDASIVKLFFMDVNKSEWLYRGSSRIWSIFEKQNTSEKSISIKQSGLVCSKKTVVKNSNVDNSERVKYLETVKKPEIVKHAEKEITKTIVPHRSVARKSTSKKTKNTVPINTNINEKESFLFKINYRQVPDTALKPKKITNHVCKHSCVAWTGYDYKETKELNMLAIPLHYGFERYIAYFKNSNFNTVLSRCVLYRTPCGRMIRSINEMCIYINMTDSAFTIDQFDFCSWVEPLAEYEALNFKKCLDDLSNGKEFRPITCINSINNELPPPMEYMTMRQAMPGVNINVDSDFLCGCDCTDNCQDKTKCACWGITIEGQNVLPNIFNDPNIGYNYRRLPERVLTGIYECNKTCKCKSSCLNRVVQQPLSHKLQLFMTEKKGWGVRCLNDIPQGSFICVYVGFLLTEADANEGGKNYGDEYLAELDYIEVVEKIKEDYESEVPPESLIFTNNSSDNSTIDEDSESNDEEYRERPPVASDILSRLRKRTKKPKPEKKKYQHADKLDKKNNSVPKKTMREYFGNNESAFIMDAKTSGNIGRYLNHSCSPNIFVQNVFVDTHDIRFPWVAFFALHYIKAGTELTWDYSYEVGSVPGKVMMCQCQSVHCRGRLL